MESHNRLQGQATMCNFSSAFKTEASKKGSPKNPGEDANCCREGGGSGSGCGGGGGSGGGSGGGGCKSQRRRPRHAHLLDEFQQLRRSMSDGELQKNPQLPEEDEDSCAEELEAAAAASPAIQNADSSDCDSQQQQQVPEPKRQHHHRRGYEQPQVPALHQRRKHKKADNYQCADIEEDTLAELQQLQEQLPLRQHKSKQQQLQHLAVSFKGDEDEGNLAEEGAVQLSLSLDDTCEFVAALDDLLELPSEEIDFPPPRDKDEDEGDETEDAGDPELVAPAVFDGGAGSTAETAEDGGASVLKPAKWSHKSAKRSQQQRQHLRRLQQTSTRSGDGKVGDQKYHDEENSAEEGAPGGEEEAAAEHDDAASSDSIFNCLPDNANDFFKLPEI